jgi:hypothetical protein
VAPQTARKPKLVRVPHDERREPFVEVFVGQGRSKRLVTTIEVLGPSNKTTGEHGRDLYLRKQREVLASKVHLVEIDLLRSGEHTTSVPHRLAVEVCGNFDYHVCVHRFDSLEDYFVYPVWIEEPLPAVSIPLLPPDAEVTIDLQAVFNRCYDAGPYRRRVQYLSEPPSPPLPEDKTEWARRLLQAAQLG